MYTESAAPFETSFAMAHQVTALTELATVATTLIVIMEAHLEEEEDTKAGEGTTALPLVVVIFCRKFLLRY